MKGLDYSVLDAKVAISSDPHGLIGEFMKNVATQGRGEGKSTMFTDMWDAMCLAAQLGGYHSERSHAEELITNVIIDFWQQKMNQVQQAVLLDSLTKIDTDLMYLDEMAMIEPPKPEKPRFPWFHHNRRW